jgi:hypothetical protein
MELFTTLFSDLLVFVYHCFDRIVIHGYLSGLSCPEQVVHFFRHVVGAPVVSKQAAGSTKTSNPPYELALSTVTARRFCDQQEISLHTATGRSLP